MALAGIALRLRGPADERGPAAALAATRRCSTTRSARSARALRRATSGLSATASEGDAGAGLPLHRGPEGRHLLARRACCASTPDVFLPPMKEVHFFDFIYLPEHRGWIRAASGSTCASSARPGLRRPTPRGSRRCRGGRTPGTRRSSTIPSRRAGDRRDHPGYAMLPPEGVARVRATNPAMKIVFIVRDPVDRALSQLRMTAGGGAAGGRRARWPRSARRARRRLARSGYSANVAALGGGVPAGQLLYLPLRQDAHRPGAAAAPGRGLPRAARSATHGSTPRARLPPVEVARA